MKNKKGDVTIAIFVIGIFVICILAILSFLASSINTRNSFMSVDYIEGTNLQHEEALFNNSKIDAFYNEFNRTNYFPWKKNVLEFSVLYEPLQE